MTGITQSILLQVAFKEAAAAVTSDIADVKARTMDLYNVLIELHNELNIDPDEGAKRGGGGGWGGSQKSTPKPTPDSVSTFTDSNGTVWKDYRTAKATNEVPAGHPDFKAGRESVWIYDQNGAPKAEGQALAAVADNFAALGSPA